MWRCADEQGVGSSFEWRLAVALNWSKYQKAIFEDAKSGTGHTAIQARAGAAKTTSLIESLNHMGTSDIWLTSFMKKITDELKSKAPWQVDVSTIHSYGFRAIKRAFGNDVKLDGQRVYKLLDQTVPQAYKEQRVELARAISKCKATLASEKEEIQSVIDRFDIDTSGVNDFIPAVIRTLDMTAELVSRDKVVDFDDMVWLPSALELPTTKFARILADEQQDFSPAQSLLLQKAAKTGSRIIICGDPEQALFTFAGAEPGGFENLVRALEAKLLSLPICYRCPAEVVRLAQQFVSDIQPAPDAPAGVVAERSVDHMLSQADRGDFILSRTNAPLVDLCFKFLAEERPAVIIGREIGDGLVHLVQKAAKRGNNDLSTTLDFIDSWTQREIAGRRKRDPDANVAMLEDRQACLHVLARHVQTPNELISKIERLFTDKADESRITLATVHSAKGLERNRVWVLEDTLSPDEGGEEARICYVAYTRAKRELYRVPGIGGRKKQEWEN